MSKETELKSGKRSGPIPSLETRWIIQVLHFQNSYHKNTALNLQRLWLTHYDHPAALHWDMEGGRATLFSLCWNIYKDKSVIVETCVNTGTDINTYSSVSTMFCSTTGKLKENQEFFFPASGSKIKRQHRICQNLQCVFHINNGSPSMSAWHEVVVTAFFNFFTITKQWERKCTLHISLSIFKTLSQSSPLPLLPSATLL